LELRPEVNAMVRQTIAVCLTAALLGAGTGLSADAPAQPSSCAFVRSIDSWKPIDKEHAYIYTSPRRKFKVTFVGPCRDLKWAIFARLETRPGGAVCLSPGDTLVFGRGSVFPADRWQFEERCMISAIEPVPLGATEEAPKTPAEPPPL
jgi:hypothetical protein